MGSFLNKKYRPEGSKPPRRRMKARPYHSLATRKGLKDELDRVTSLIVRKRDGMCVTCGEARPEFLTCSHFYKRVWVNTRWDLRNCHCQCADCNQLHNENVWPYTNFFLNTFDTSVMAELFELRNRRETPSTDELRYMLSEYRQMLREMS
jgi:hypothetical protein